MATNDTNSITEGTANVSVGGWGVLENDNWNEEHVQRIRVGTTGNWVNVSNGASGTTVTGTYGTLKILDGGGYTYTPNQSAIDFLGANDTATDVFQYETEQYNNQTQQFNRATLTITINGVNDAPVTANDTASTNEDTAVVIDVRVNDSDPDSQLGNPIVVSQGSHGTATMSNGKITYTPNANFNGTDTFTYKLKDGSVDSNVATVTVTVAPVDDAPTGAAPTTLTAINENSGPRTITLAELLGTLADVDGALSVTNLQKVGGGTLTGSSPTWTYTPAANDSSSVTFTYTITGGGNNLAKSVTMDLLPVNAAPVGAADSYSVAEDGTLTVTAANGVLKNDSDPNGDAFTMVLQTEPTHGTLSGVTSAGNFTYKPNADFWGTDTFTYKVVDSKNASSSDVTVTINVTPVNDAPVAVADTYNLAEDATLNAPSVLANDTDKENNVLTATLVTDAAHGHVVMSADGNFTYTPNKDFNGVDTFTYKANDGTDNSNVVTVTLNVSAVNDAPAAGTAVANVDGTEDTAVSFTIPANAFTDVDSANLTYSATLDSGASLPTWLVFNPATRTFSGTPTPDYNGSLSIKVSASDGQYSASQTFTLNIAAVDDPAVAHDDSYSVDEDQVLTVTAGNSVFLNDVDVDGPALLATGNTNPLHGTLTATNGQAGTFTYKPDANFHGTDTLTYTLAGGSTATITITVNSVNDVPLVDQTIANVNGTEDTAVNFTIAANAFKDADGDSLTYSATLSDGSPLPSWLNFDAGSRTFSGTPTKDYNGALDIKVTATDGVVGTTPASQTFTLTLAPTNDAPTVAAPLTATATEDGATVSISALQGATDVDGDAMSVTVVGGLPDGVSFDGAATFTLDPKSEAFQSLGEGEVKTVTVNYTISDGHNGTVAQTATWTVTGTNDVPVAMDDTYTLLEDGSVADPGPGHFANDIDPDQGDVEFQGALVNGPQHGKLERNGKEGGLTYTPDANYNGEDSFTYTIKDKYGATSNVATVKFIITAVNDKPVVTGTLSASANEDSGVSTVSAISNVTDVDGDAIIVTDYTPKPGLTYDDATKSFKLDTNNAAYQGLKAGETMDVVVSYNVSDGKVQVADSIKWTITGVNDAPTALVVSNQVAIDENSAAGTAVANLSTTDADTSDTFTYAVSNANFEVVNNKLVVKAGAVLNFEAGATQTVTVTSTDSAGASVSKDVTVTLKDVNEAPTSTNQTVSSDENVSTSKVLATFNAVDPDVGGGNDNANTYENLTYSIVGGDSANLFEINGAGEITLRSGKVLNYEAGSSYILTVKATDGGNLSTTSTVTINVNDVNEKPEITNGSTISINENQTAVTTITVADPDANDTKSFTLSGKDSSKFDISSTGVLTLKNAANFEADNSYSVTVKVTDSKGLWDTKDLTINVKDVNEAPTSTNQTVSVDENISTTKVIATANALDPDVGGGNDLFNIFDPFNDAWTYDNLSYAITGGNEAGLFEINNDGEITLKAGKVLNYEAGSSYTLTVKAMDGGGLSTSSTVTINVNDVNEKPEITNGSTISIDENQTAVTTITVADPDANDTKSFTLSGKDSSKFDISNTGVLTLKNAANFEADNSYSLTVKVTDSKGLWDTKDLTVNIKDVNEAPTTADVSSNPIAENTAAGTVLATVVGTDPDTGGGNDASNTYENLTYSIVGGDPDSLFTIDSSGQVKLAANKALDFETKESHVLTVRSTDGGGLFKDSTVTINVADVNDNTPTFTSAATFFVFENNGLNVGTVKATDADKSAAFNTITYTISGGADAGLFDIDGATGALKLKNAANFEAKGSYSLTVKASDGTLDKTQDVTVTVTDLNEAPNQPADVTVSVPEDSAVGAVLATVVGSDPDLGGGNDAANDFENLNYSISSGNTGNLFTIDTISGQIKLATGKALDFETAGSHVLTVRTTDGLGLWKESTVTINVTDVNEAPNKPADVTATFAESTAAGTVLATVVGSDPDLGGGNDANNTYENLSYSITGGDPDGLFTINAATGAISLATGKALDYEKATSHVLTVTTTDGPGLTKTSTVTINVTDVNDVAPVFTLAGLQTPGGTYETSAQENISTSTVVLDAAATDGDASPDFKIIAYSLAGADADKFNISSTGKVTFKASPNFDVAGDANANNIYAITVSASDGVHTVSKDVAIQLTDLNDIAPVITSGATATFAENGTGTVYTATATDADLTPAFRNIVYSLAAGGDNDLFNINATTGVVTFKAAPNFEAPLDSDKNNTYVLSVLASDGVNPSTPKTVTVTVTDLVEDSGPANTAGLTITSANATINDATPLITGVASTAQAGQTVTLFEGTTARGTGVVQTNGTWSIESTNVGADGAHSFTAQLGSSVSNSVTLNIDTVAPVVTITGTTGTGFSPTVNGTASVADVGRTVTLFDGTTAVGTGVVGAGGAFSVSALLTGTGPHSLTARVVDLAGNVGTSAVNTYTIAPQPAQGQIDSDNLDAAYLNIMDSASLRAGDKDFMLDLKTKLSVNLVTYKQALDALIDRADGSTSVATLSYQFFTGKIPTKAGMDYLVSETGGNANNINSAYYQDFNIENRYINFAVNLGHDGAGKDAFQTKYGALSLFDATKKAYAEIFGATPTDTKVHELLDTTFTFGGKTITRADYFTAYGHDAIGTKAAMVGWLLSEAAKADVGTYATANEAFLSDLADGATFNVDLIGTYGSKAIPLEVLG